ncbi:hypothetical protein E2I00_002780 [Balaenoptera physalus]|uniref:Iroquois-class homeodomain protein domain-containing protein n=1 Tax=Balaenoptera physalus TaxID=9770 RepID=A0A6A1Q9B8_BALPH|nr:hypothetical protein E2I00_002780 [Balaenoptera physalus]
MYSGKGARCVSRSDAMHTTSVKTISVHFGFTRGDLRRAKRAEEPALGTGNRVRNRGRGRLEAQNRGAEAGTRKRRGSPNPWLRTFNFPSVSWKIVGPETWALWPRELREVQALCFWFLRFFQTWFLVSASSNATCCESAPRSVPDVASGSTPAAALCFAPYDSRLLGSARPELGAALGIYGAPYSAAAAAQSYAGYLPYSPEPPTLYGALKENKMTWAPKNKGGEERKEEGGAEELLGCLNGDTKDVSASQEARGLSDLEDLEEEEEEEADEEEAVATATDRLAELHQDTQSPPAAQCAAAREGRLERRECSLAAPRFSFTEPPRSGETDFLRAEPGGRTLTMHYPRSEKPRIWSLAHTAAGSGVEGTPPNLSRPRSPECHLIHGQPPGPGARPAVPRDSACEESSRVAKAFGNPSFAQQGLPLDCAPCPRRRAPAVRCQYQSGAEGSGPPTALGASVQKTPSPDTHIHPPTPRVPSRCTLSLPLQHAQVQT